VHGQRQGNAKLPVGGGVGTVHGQHLPVLWR
jgi:hypothetical protein